MSDLYERSGFPARAKALAKAAIGALGEAESRAHGTTIDQVHFHEVGALDALVDIGAFALAITYLDIERIHCRPLALGRGMFQCAHGSLPVPGPAVLNLVTGYPTRPCSVDAELVTPTGAACLRALSPEFGEPPTHTILASGVGAGDDDRPAMPNVLRVWLGETCSGSPGTPESVVTLRCDVDDMTGEELGALRERARNWPILDLTILPLQMKKDRPGHRLECVVAPPRAAEVADLLLRHTSSFGVRWFAEERRVLRREFRTVQLPEGPCRVKLGWLGSECVKAHAESDDVRGLSTRSPRSFREIAEDAARRARAE